MKPVSFDYTAPDTLEEVLALLGQHGREAKVLAGGQTLVPRMAFRFERPAVVIDIGRVAGLDRREPRDQLRRAATRRDT